MNTIWKHLALAVAALGALAGLAATAHRAGAQQAGPGGGVISGRVTFPDGTPAPGVRVTARSDAYVSSAPAATALTGADGRYALRVDTGAYARLFAAGAPRDLGFTVAVTPGDALYAVPADRAVTLTGGPSPAAAGVDFGVTPGPQVTVRVRDAVTGRPVPGVVVEYPSIGGGNAPGDVAGTTDAQGQARFRSHKLDFNLQIRTGPDLAAGPGAPSYGLYKQYRLTPADSVVWDVSVYDPTATVSVVWRGVLLGPDGRPAPDVLVRRVGQRYGGRSATEDVATDAGGRFTFPGTSMAAAEYLAQRQSDSLYADKGDASAVMAPTLEEVTGGITLRLVRNLKASLTGRVTDPDGALLAGVFVRGWGNVRGGPPQVVDGSTDSAGRFTLTGLYPGTGYFLQFGGPSYGVPVGAPGGYFGRTQLPPVGADGTYPRLSLEGGERRDVGTVVVLRADDAVVGRVLGPDGRPVAAPLAVVIYGDHTRSDAYPNADGAFRAEHVAREPLTLSVYKMIDRSYSGGRDSTDYIARLPVRAGDLAVRVSVPAQPAPPPSPAPAPRPAPPVASVPPAPQPPPHPVTAPPAPGAGPVPDEVAAVRAGQRFLTALGQPGPVSVLPERSPFPPRRTAPDIPRLAVAPVWRLSLPRPDRLGPARPDFLGPAAFVPGLFRPGGAQMVLSRDAGIVSLALIPAGADAPGPPASAPLTEDQAIRRGLAVLRAAGHAQGLRLTDIGLEPISHQWILHWTRLFHGVPFPLGGSVTVVLDEATGRLAGLGTLLRQNDPPTDEVRVDAAHARAIADPLLTQAGLPPLGAPATPPSRQVVVPDDAWGAAPPPPGPARFSPDRARVAWVVQRALPPPATGAAEVWVDAQTGAVLGGVRPAPPAPAPPPAPLPLKPNKA